MILMQIVAVMGKDQIRGKHIFQFFKIRFYIAPIIRKEAISIFQNFYFLSLCMA